MISQLIHTHLSIAQQFSANRIGSTKPPHLFDPPAQTSLLRAYVLKLFVYVPPPTLTMLWPTSSFSIRTNDKAWKRSNPPRFQHHMGLFLNHPRTSHPNWFVPVSKLLTPFPCRFPPLLIYNDGQVYVGCTFLFYF